jgi:hypothetical protein
MTETRSPGVAFIGGVRPPFDLLAKAAAPSVDWDAVERVLIAKRLAEQPCTADLHYVTVASGRHGTCLCGRWPPDRVDAAANGVYDPRAGTGSDR